MSENTNIPTELTAPTITPIPPAPKSKNWLLIIFSLIITILLAVITFFLYKNYLSQQSGQIKPPAVIQTEPTPTKEAIISTPTLAAQKEPTLVSLDNTWNLYTNYQLGFSLKVPKISTGAAPCAWNDKNGDHSYRPASGPVPVKIFEEPNGIYVDHEYTYKLTGETKENNRSFFSGCDKETITLSSLKSERQTWHIISEKVTNNQELLAFVKKNFQPGCEIAGKKPSSQTGVFDVEVKDERPPETSECFLNYMYVLRYIPEKGVAFTWDMGQEVKFYSDNNASYDGEMLKSFLVL